MNLLEKIRSWFNREKLDADMAEEMRLPLARCTCDKIAEGLGMRFRAQCFTTAWLA